MSVEINPITIWDGSASVPSVPNLIIMKLNLDLVDFKYQNLECNSRLKSMI